MVAAVVMQGTTHAESELSPKRSRSWNATADVVGVAL